LVVTKILFYIFGLELKNYDHVRHQISRLPWWQQRTSRFATRFVGLHRLQGLQEVR
jgi:hypothetical protein